MRASVDDFEIEADFEVRVVAARFAGFEVFVATRRCADFEPVEVAARLLVGLRFDVFDVARFSRLATELALVGIANDDN
ncbi:MAG: hypothetical protein ABI867_22480 [Kofleriaceae bacterium]